MPGNAESFKIVTARDRLLMKWIGTNGVASFKQLHTVFWPGARERACQERLVQLEKAGLLERHYVYTSRKRGEQVYTLTRQAAIQHFEAVTRKRLMIGLPAKAELKQQLTAQDTRITLERLLAPQGKHVVDWLNERELRRVAANLKRKADSRVQPWAREGLTEVADARVFISLTSIGAATNTGKQDNQYENIQSMDIEIDGPYYGQMLKNKISAIARRNQPTLWVTTSDRARQAKSEIKQSDASNIRVIAVDPLL